jgi:hypothetical protein
MEQKQGRDGTRRGLRLCAVLSSLVLAPAGLGACREYDGEDSPELQEILRDGELTQVMRSALTTMLPPDASPADAASPAAGGPTIVDSGAGGAGGAGEPGEPGRRDAGVAGAFGTGGRGPGMGFAGMPGMGGSGPDGGVTRNFPAEAQALWRFDDCNMGRTELGDSSFAGGHTAFRSVTAFCRPGVFSSGIGFDENDDVVIVPDQPHFVFSEGFTVAAWVKPVALGGVRTIFRKRQEGTSTFVLVENGQSFQIVINLANGRAAEVQARATLDKFTHVAATYDGIFLKLYLDGVEAASRRVVGRLSEGVGPLLMGNDAKLRRIDGVLDNVVFDTVAATPEEIARLTCLPRPSVMSVTPVDPPAVPVGTPVSYDVQITNNSCEDASFNLSFPFQPSSDIILEPSFGSAFVPAAATARLSFTATAAQETETFGKSEILVNGELFASDFQSFTEAVSFSVIDNSTPCTIFPRRELVIRDVSVVDDPVRTAPGGAWSFGKLMENMAPTPADAPAMVERMLTSFLSQQTVNSFTLPARPGVQRVLDSMRGPDGKLDLSRPSFRLLAIVNRIDLHDEPASTGGEGRFVFGFTPFGQTTPATLIIEYNVPSESRAAIVDLAKAWHALRALPFPSEEYNAALQAVTERFTARNAAPGRPNGSSLGQIRTNDFFAFGRAWEFREFHLDPASGMLVPAPVAQTPDRGFNSSEALGRFVRANEPAIFTDKHVVPLMFEGVPFQGGNNDASDFFTWQVPGVSPEARHRFARNTCNGCHTFRETGGGEFQISPRQPFQEASLSPFLLGASVPDLSAGVTRHFNEIRRRARVLHDLVCPEEMLPPLPPDTTPLNGGMGGRGGGVPRPRPNGGVGGAAGSAEASGR